MHGKQPTLFFRCIIVSVKSSTKQPTGSKNGMELFGEIRKIPEPTYGISGIHLPIPDKQFSKKALPFYSAKQAGCVFLQICKLLSLPHYHPSACRAGYFMPHLFRRILHSNWQAPGSVTVTALRNNFRKR